MDFLLFLLVNATLFVRPAEFVESVQALPIYNILMVLCLAAGLLPIVGKLGWAAVRAEPITACVLAFLGAIVLSNLAQFKLMPACEAGLEFAKVVLYYLVMVTTLRTPVRLRVFLAFLVVNIVVLASLALLHYHGLVNIPALAAVADAEVDARTGEQYTVMRLCSTGIFNDPNDLSLILIVGIGSALFLSGADPGGLPRPYWLAPVALFLYALTLTYSRGGFLALLVGVLVLFHARYGVRKAALLGSLVLPALVILFAGRQTDISTSGDTGQDRIQLWAKGLQLLKASPLFGIGPHRYAEEVGLVAHNSFVHAYVELGTGGGCLFVGAFAYACWTLRALAPPRVELGDPMLARLRPFLLAITVGYAFGMLTVSRNYTVPTYLVLGLDAAYLALVAAGSPRLVGPDRPIRPVSSGLVGRGLGLGLAFLVVINLFIKGSVRW